jgi:hypothetical protein
MFIASESYSGSVYEMDFSMPMESCDEEIFIVEVESLRGDVSGMAA